MKETTRHVAAFRFYRDMERRSLVVVANSFSVSEMAVNNWNKAFGWQKRLIAWDNAIKEGVDEHIIDAVVETRINELNIIDTMISEIDAMTPLIRDALEAGTKVDNEGVRHCTIVPETTQDMVALYAAQTKFIAAKTKLIEVVRKVRGEKDTSDDTTNVNVMVAVSPEIAAKVGEAIAIETET